MELIYIWIRCSKNKFIQKQGFNFYGEHQFDLSEENNIYNLHYEFKSNVLGSKIFDKTHVKNITAIVGENGSGKSTLLSEITHINFFAEQSYKEGIDDYSNYRKQQNEEHYNICAYKDSNGEIVIYHNFEKGILNNCTKFQSYSANEIREESQGKYIEIMDEFNALQSTIYLSSSSYSFEHNGFDHALNNVSLTSNGFNAIAKNFWDKISLVPSGGIRITPFNLLQNILTTQLNSSKFQNLCDVLYYYKLYTNKRDVNYLAKVCKEIQVSFSYFPAIVDGISNYGGRLSLHDEKINEIKQKLDYINVSCREMVLSSDRIIGNLYINLIYELLFCWDISLEEFKDINANKIKKTLDKLIKGRENNYQENISHEFEKEKKYYANALCEICKLENMLNKCNDISNTLPKSDLAYKDGKVISLSLKPELYWDFCRLINEFSIEDSSFVLKYIGLDGLTMSSGERAIQNFFSWINLMPFFNQIMSKDINELNDNILLLIDEIDLYIHPEWQRKMVEYLIAEIEMQFPSKKVQVILTTHSPLVLSDIPAENIIFLKPNENMFHQEDDKIQTFASNIHTILKNEFFMSSTMGEFAKNKIEVINKSLNNYIEKKGKVEEEIDLQYAELVISTIGEPLIRNGLEDKLLNAKQSYQTSKLKDAIKIYKEMSSQEKNRLISYIIEEAAIGDD